ncbi:Phosphatidylinositol transfer protein alpha isoform isoform 1 [Schistosoma japonicum]|uniref:Phosphatidylinositol transfer protein alpha isoform isoform 1 n=1 Tax=Schistosoma japonicum TaxID=6182 RepID=A0A4Z2DV07_SCHJA|nr:Phosphatidylinositol transfer protein alpha isoform isoform 1 [Schistosoma japonicum]
MIIKEFRIILPLTVDEYRVGQLWAVAEASKNETGGGEGIEVLVNEPFDREVNPPESPLIANGEEFFSGQYTHKRFYLASKVPGYVRFLAPKGSLEVDEKAWNAYPYCRTILQNPKYMQDNFTLIIESMHVQDKVNIENIHNLPPKLLAQREVIYIDIANDQLHIASDYDPSCDPRIYQSVKTGRGPLVGPRWWENTDLPIMCAYKLVTCEFKWWGIQGRVENMIQSQERRIFLNFNRQVFCWLDKWHGLSMSDIRDVENKTKEELDQVGLLDINVSLYFYIVSYAIYY